MRVIICTFGFIDSVAERNDNQMVSYRYAPSARTKWLLAIALVVSACVFAVSAAMATNDTYCAACTLASNGTPAVSSTEYHFTNAITLISNPDNIHIYYYNVSTSSTTCEWSGFNSWGGSVTCANTATARCQLLSGNRGGEAAYCYDTY
jgi:hypothetical protein